MLDAFLGGAIAGYGIAIPVGAIAILIVGVGMRSGFACAASAGAGAATADLIYAMIAVVAGTAAARLLEPWAGPIKVVSAAILAAIAVKGLWDARRAEPPARESATVGRGELAATYARFVGLTIINPLTVVYFTTLVLGSSAGNLPTPVEAGAFVVGAFLASLSWQTMLAGVGAFAHRGLPPRFRSYTMVLGNLLILAIAVRIAW